MVNLVRGQLLDIAGPLGRRRERFAWERENSNVRGTGQRPVNAMISRYEQCTDNVIVRVEPEFLAEQSNPSDSRFIWAYTVEIDNQSGRDLTVTDRFWQIADSAGSEIFRYTSGAPLTAPSGMMRGSYTMRAECGESFDIAVPAFLLDSPYEGLSLN